MRSGLAISGIVLSTIIFLFALPIIGIIFLTCLGYNKIKTVR